MNSEIPSQVIAAVASVIAGHYFNHTDLNALFAEEGAPGEPPAGNCEDKCNYWLKRCNEDLGVDPFEVLGGVLKKYMDKETSDSKIEEGRGRIKKALGKNQLSYQVGGHIVRAGANSTSKTLVDYFKTGDFSSIEKEFDRALGNITTDPHAAMTAASSIIEALCKTYIETFTLELPNKQSVVPLWKTVQAHIGLNIDPQLKEDQKKVLQGLSSIVDGVGALRTHIGSAHGRGIAPPNIVSSEARLAVNASHALVTFIMERWHDKSA